MQTDTQFFQEDSNIPSDRANTAKGADRVEEILKTTLDIIAVDGHAGLTLEGVAKRVGIKKGNLQYYFPSRAHLLRAALSRMMDRHREEWILVHDRHVGNPLHCIKRLVAFELKANEDEKFLALVRERWSLETHDEGTRSLRDRWYDWVTGRYADLIARLRPELGERACRQLAITIYSMLVGSAPFFGPNRTLPRWSKGMNSCIEDAVLSLITVNDRESK